MDKLPMQTPNLTLENIEKIEKLFPSCIVESEDDEGNKIKKVDFDLLRAELGDKTTVEGLDERYRLDWPGKKRSILKANTPITKTLRPVKEDSVDWDTTQNLYIEGDNFEVLKILQESYLGKIKMIYIDPPYNTGNDFVYNDDFSESSEEYKERTEQDVEGYKMVKNTESNGRFHSDWLSMMYERLKVARDLLKDDGVMFISIDDNEVDNLRKICDEIFGEKNFQSCISRRRRSNQPNDVSKMIAKVTEYILVYSKDEQHLRESKGFGTIELSEERLSSYTNPDDDPNGPWSTTPRRASKGQGGSKYKIITPTGIEYYEVWLGTQDTFEEHLKNGRIIFPNNGDGKPRKKIYAKDAKEKGQAAIDFWVGDRYGDNQVATSDLKKIFGVDRIFDFSKPVKLLENIIRIGCPNDGIVLDFFSGSSVTAHATLEFNAKNSSNKKFIMVQLPELTEENSDAYKVGYKNICEIGKERIRRAGKKIKEETNADMDYGFRVYRVDESCMKDVYYHPSEAKQENLALFTSNIKEDRTPEDLLTQVILDLGLTLDLPIEEKTIGNNKVFYVAGNSLIVCFDENIDDNVIDEIAKDEPIKLVFRDACFKDDAQRINVENKVKRVSPETIIKVI